MKYLIAIILFAGNVFADETAEYQWIQYSPNNQLIARATTIAKECPEIKIDDKQFAMNLRAQQEDLELKQIVKICEYNVTTASKVSIRNKQLKLPPKQLNRFIVLGDTGCEASIFDPKHVNQNCDDSKAWPFEELANKIAQANPDFVIHMGDYAYRNKYKNEQDGLKNQQMQWFFFKNEFFHPARNLLNKAPMIFIRGNHESCKSMGKGWYLFLDPYNYTKECMDQSPAYNLQINDLNFVVFDSSSARSGKDYPEAQSQQFKSQFADIVKKLNQPAWLLIHTPILGLEKLSAEESFNPKINMPVVSNAFEQAFTKKIPLAISGHFHVAAYVKRQSDNFEQFILGNGGTLIHRAKFDSYPYEANDVTGLVKIKYGYLQFDRINERKWKATGYAVDGSILFEREVNQKKAL